MPSRAGFSPLSCLLQMCTVHFVNRLASCNFPASPGQEGIYCNLNYQPEFVLELSKVARDFIHPAHPTPATPRSGSVDMLQPVLPLHKAPLFYTTLTRGLFARDFAPSNAGFAEGRILRGWRECCSNLHTRSKGRNGAWDELLPPPCVLDGQAKGGRNGRGSVWGCISASSLL